MFPGFNFVRTEVPVFSCTEPRRHALCSDGFIQRGPMRVGYLESRLKLGSIPGPPRLLARGSPLVRQRRRKAYPTFALCSG
jgi:hypothetical protein